MKKVNYVNFRVQMKNVFFVAMFLIACYNLRAFQSMDKSNYYDYGKKFYCDAYTLPHPVKDSVNVLAMYRYSNSLLSFKKSTNPSKGDFVAIAQFQIEFRDTTGIIKKREIVTDSLWTIGFDDTKSNTIFNYGSIKLSLPVGDYAVLAELSDNGKNKIKELNLPHLSKTTFLTKNSIGMPFFCIAANSNESLLTPNIFNHNVNFSSNTAKILMPVVFKGKFIKYNYMIEYVEQKLGNIEWGDAIKITGQVSSVEFQTVNISKYSNLHKIYLDYQSDSSISKTNPGYKSGLLELELPSDKNIPGTYQILLWEDRSKDTAKFTFKVEWEDMPLVLKRVDLAIESMLLILTDKEFDEMKSGNDKKVFRKILDYWRKKDPTPFTVYNEAMTEFFKRVDYAFFNYKTITETNGFKTDRGKIYVLNGKPAKSVRNIGKDSSIEEIWTYPNLKQEYIFVSNSKGQFTLEKIKDLK